MAFGCIIQLTDAPLSTHLAWHLSPAAFLAGKTQPLPLTARPGSTNFSQGLIRAVCKHINWQLIWWFCSRCACKSGVWTWQAAFSDPYGLAAEAIFHLLLPPLFFTQQTNAPNESHSIWFSGADEGGRDGGREGRREGELWLPHSCSIHIHLVSTCWDVAQNQFLLFRYVNFPSSHDLEHDDVRVSSTAATVCRVIQHYCSISSFLSTS